MDQLEYNSSFQEIFIDIEVEEEEKLPVSWFFLSEVKVPIILIWAETNRLRFLVYSGLLS